MLEPITPPTNWKKSIPQTTLVIRVRTADCAILNSLLEAYKDHLPPKIGDIFEQIMTQLPK